VDSVLAQTYTNLVVIVVDDGSTDGGGEIVGGYTDPRVKLIVQENTNQNAARNRGVAEAETEWLAFLDADDEWLPTFLERTVAVAEANPSVSAVFSNIRCGDTNTNYLKRKRKEGIVRDYLRLFVENGRRGATCSSIMLRKQALLDAGGFPGHVGQGGGGDQDTWTRLSWTCEMAYVPETLAVWHVEAAGREIAHGAKALCHSHEPAIVSYRLWKEQGRIPEHLLESSRRFVHQLFLKQARFLTDSGDSAGARRVLRTECQPSLCGWPEYLKVYVRTFIPGPLLEMRRKVARLLHTLHRSK
jgi:cellulose synthase/poly-beta-1,6-N-acetylglucosamine synthase-like glycosyltransferase